MSRGSVTITQGSLCEGMRRISFWSQLLSFWITSIILSTCSLLYPCLCRVLDQWRISCLCLAMPCDCILHVLLSYSRTNNFSSVPPCQKWDPARLHSVSLCSWGWLWPSISSLFTAPVPELWAYTTIQHPVGFIQCWRSNTRQALYQLRYIPSTKTFWFSSFLF